MSSKHPRSRTLLRALLLTTIAAAVAVAVAQGPNTTDGKPLTLTEALELVENGQVSEATMSDQSLTLTLTLSGEDRTVVAPYSATYSEKLVERLLNSNVNLTTTPNPRPGLLAGTLLNLLPLIIIVGGVLLILRRGSGTLGLGKLQKGRGEPVVPPATRFSGVAGCDEAVAELAEVVDILLHPERYRAVNAHIPRGYLLAGPPGTGKTLLAQAVAGEAGVPFFAVSGSEFVEVFVGQGAGRVRDLFSRARSHPAAIVFIDEIDAVGRARTATGATGANVETENTLNQLLAEMDGFSRGNIIILAATNRPDMLDKALTRAGRFDRTIQVPAPDRAGRRKLLELYLARHPVETPVNIEELSRRCVGMTGADIANLTNRAALEAARNGREHVTQSDLEQALATVTLGPERRSAVMTDRDRTVTAWHEAGHTLAALLLPGANNPVAVSIVPRGPTGGVTWLSGSDNQMPTRTELADQLCVSLAGRAGERLGLGGDFTAGAHNDLAVATELAETMITQWGMGDGSLAVRRERILERADIDREIDHKLKVALKRATELLDENHTLLSRIVAALLDRETLTADELEALANSVQTYGQQPGADID